MNLTLTHIAQGGIYDHLGGGFARYSVDPRWLVPHFEKMLYDNTLLLDLMTEAWREQSTPLYAERVAETVEWLLREMVVEGGFASSLDADSEGEEGKFYVWSLAEIEDVLGKDDAALLAEIYNVTETGNFVVSNNGMEWAITYFVMLLALFFIGAGKLSVDHLLRGKLALRKA